MCIAIYKPASSIISEDTLRTCFESNPDGAGFMYVDEDQLIVKKGFFDFESFYEEYSPTQDKQNVIHFRIKTHGEVDTENCHPFNIDNDLAFVHNGVISDVTIKDENKSDTWHFNQNYLRGIRQSFPDFLSNKAIKEMISKYIGYSKLIFLDRFGNADIINSSKGEWEGDVWYSNTSYKKRSWGTTGSSVPKLVIKLNGVYQMAWSRGNILKGERVVLKSFGQDNDVWVQPEKGGDPFRVGTIWLDALDDKEEVILPYSKGDILYVLTPFNGFDEDDVLEIQDISQSGTYFKLSNGKKVAWSSGGLIDEHCYESITMGMGV